MALAAVAGFSAVRKAPSEAAAASVAVVVSGGDAAEGVRLRGRRPPPEICLVHREVDARAPPGVGEDGRSFSRQNHDTEGRLGRDCGIVSHTDLPAEREASRRRAASRWETASRCCAEEAIAEANRLWVQRKAETANGYVRELTLAADSSDTIQTLSLLTLTAVAVVGAVVWLQGVLVPFVLAIFGVFILEPLLLFLLNPVRLLAWCMPAMRPTAAALERSRIFFLSSGTSPKDVRNSSVMARLLWRTWAVVAVLTCILVMLIVIISCLVIVGKSIEKFEWEKYEKSPRMKQFLRVVRSIGGESAVASSSGGFDWLMQGPLVIVLQMIAQVFSTLFLTALFMIFLLLSVAGSDPPRHLFGLSWYARASVQRYLRIKTQTSAAVAILVWLVFRQLEVDLGAFFAFITFLLNFIPHVGYTIAVIAPLPLVYLDPTKDTKDIVLCTLWPTLIHQIFSSGIEPWLMAKSLDLHPVIVIISVVFWVVCWGAVGAVLSMPITCIARLVFQEIDHHYAQAFACLLEGRVLTAIRGKDFGGPAAGLANPTSFNSKIRAVAPSASARTAAAESRGHAGAASLVPTTFGDEACH